jgi:hypothetical protein
MKLQVPKQDSFVPAEWLNNGEERLCAIATVGSSNGQNIQYKFEALSLHREWCLLLRLLYR